MSDKKCRVANTPKFNEIRKGDCIVYYAYPDRLILGLFQVTSNMKILENNEYYKNYVCYEIEAIQPTGNYLDLSKLKLAGQDKFDTFPNGILSEKFSTKKICVEISNKDYNKFKDSLNNKAYFADKEKSDNISIFFALLEFYGNRATSFVSLFVASIFGIVTLSAILQVIEYSINPIDYSIIPLLLSVGPFVGFSVAGYYTLEKYFYYGDLAEKIKSNCIERPHFLSLNEVLVKNTEEGELIGFIDYMHKGNNKQKKHPIKVAIDKKYALLSVYVIMLILLAIVVYWN